MNLISALQLDFIVAGLKMKFQKDAYRIALFQAVCFKRIGELAANDADKVVPFAEASAALIGRWTERAVSVAKNPFGFLFTDPFKGLRADTRDFAKTWSLDKSFVDAMG